MRLFLKSEKSRFTNPGPMIVLRPRLPRSVMGSALETLRFDVVFGLPGLMGEPQPGAESKFGTSMLGRALHTEGVSSETWSNGTPCLLRKLLLFATR